MTDEQLAIVAEITQEPYATIVSLVSSLTEAQEERIVDDTDLWDANRNDVDVWLSDPGGVNWQAKELLSAIRVRTRSAFGLPLYSEQTHASSGAVTNRFVF